MWNSVFPYKNWEPVVINYIAQACYHVCLRLSVKANIFKRSFHATKSHNAITKKHSFLVEKMYKIREVLYCTNGLLISKQKSTNRQ